LTMQLLGEVERDFLLVLFVLHITTNELPGYEC
jgi:hypothetical protein